MTGAAHGIGVVAVRGGIATPSARSLAEETAVAFVYQQTTQAVMMATPADLEDFGVGFSLTEEIVADPAEIESLDVAAHPQGIEIRMWLGEDRAVRLGERRRFMAGPVGCGLCGIDSLVQAIRPLPSVAGTVVELTAEELAAAPEALRGYQPLNDATTAVHAAGFLVPGRGLVLVREDVGRHNALDKLIGAMARQGIDTAIGAAVLTSRVSVEMVQKCAVARIPAIVATSAPTAHAVRLAEGAGMLLAARARGGAFEIYVRPDRVTAEAAHVV